MRGICQTLALLAILAAIEATAISSSDAQQSYRLRFLGFSPSTPPADSLVFRQALASALDRESIVQAVAPYLRRAPRAAETIQHPGLPGYTPSMRGYQYDPDRAKEFFRQSSWTGTILILSGPATDRFVEAFHAAVQLSLRKALETSIIIQPVANSSALVRAAKTGSAPIYLLTWGSDPSDFGYPSFALGLAHELGFDGEVRSLLGQRDSAEVEKILLDKALVVPIIHY